MALRTLGLVSLSLIYADPKAHACPAKQQSIKKPAITNPDSVNRRASRLMLVERHLTLSFHGTARGSPWQKLHVTLYTLVSRSPSAFRRVSSCLCRRQGRAGLPFTSSFFLCLVHLARILSRRSFVIDFLFFGRCNFSLASSTDSRSWACPSCLAPREPHSPLRYENGISSNSPVFVPFVLDLPWWKVRASDKDCFQHQCSLVRRPSWMLQL